MFSAALKNKCIYMDSSRISIVLNTSKAIMNLFASLYYISLYIICLFKDEEERCFF
jgi:hypothetical protein